MPKPPPESAPNPASPPPRRTSRLHLLPIVALALLLRLGLVWISATHHSFDRFYGEATELAKLAASLDAGQGLSSPFGGNTGPSAFLPPGYPALVAAIFTVFHPYSLASAVTLTILQAIFGAATVAVLMRLAQRLFGNAAANLAGTLCAISPPLIFLTTLFWETALTTLLFTSLIALAIPCADSPTLPRWISAGAFSALCLALNPALLLVVCCTLAWAAWQSRPASLKPLLLAAATCLLLSAPWAIRNQRALHAFIPFRSNLGYELWQGNRPGADGFFAAWLHPNVNPQEFTRYQTLGEVGYMREKSTLAQAAIHAAPSRFLALTVKRFAYFWTGVARAPAPTLTAYIVLTTLGGAAGLYLLARRSRALAMLFALPLAFFPAPYYITHPDPRFRLILDPLLILLAAYAISVCLLPRKRSTPA